jgi:hypothetical protein
MKARKTLWLILVLMVAFGLLLTACDNDTDGEDEDEEGAEGNPAMVDSVMVEEQMGHKYAVVNGNYPDSCSKISDVDQDLEGNTFKISLTTGQPEDLVCAQMLSPFTVNILLEVGGQAPGEYSVTVNDSATTTFNIGG